MHKVSVIIPVYNAENYLEECILSLVNQTYHNIELIFVNDGSTDNSTYILNKYKNMDHRIRVFHKKNEGVSIARNTGIKQSTGEFITFVDSDDWVSKNMIEFAVDKALFTNSDIIMWSYYKNFLNEEERLSVIPGGNQIFDQNRDELILKSVYALYGLHSIESTMSSGTTWGKLYRSSLIKDNQILFKPELTRAQDSIFSIKAFAKANMIYYYDKSLYHYRISDTSTCSGNRYLEDTFTPFDSLLKEFYSLYKELDLGEKFFEPFYGRIIQVLFWHIKHNIIHEKNNRTFIGKRQQLKRLTKRPFYKQALTNPPYNLLPKKEKIITILLKNNLYISILIFYNLLKFKEKFESIKYN